MSGAGLFDTHQWDEFPGRSIPSLMEEFADERVDLLKMDTEGTEYEILPALDLQGLGVKVLAVCLHHNGSVSRARSLVAHLGSLGYQPVAVRPALKMTFAHQGVLGTA